MGSRVCACAAPPLTEAWRLWHARFAEETMLSFAGIVLIESSLSGRAVCAKAASTDAVNLYCDILNPAGRKK
jgi:hypothetical protein